MQYSLSFPSGNVTYRFIHSFEAALKQDHNIEDCILITDSNIARSYPSAFISYRTIIIPAGEDQKTLETIASVIDQLLNLEAHRNTLLIGIGGGVVTDITGFVASVYMRGIGFGFVPTTLLGMVDAAIGGKNGVNTQFHKNIAGTVCQPSFILFDSSSLATLPADEWSNGFAEIIKYACLFDPDMFEDLSRHDVKFYRNNLGATEALVAKCAGLKNKVVLTDENESGERKLLNFGHSAGHALEKQYGLPHGRAVAIGMVIACKISENITGLDSSDTSKITQLLQQYGLPTAYHFDPDKVGEILRSDKKRKAKGIEYILLNSIGRPVVKLLSFDVIAHHLSSLNYAGNY